MLKYNPAKVFERVNNQFKKYLQHFSELNIVDDKPYIPLENYIFKPTNKAHTTLAGKLNKTKITYPFCNFYWLGPIKLSVDYNNWARQNRGFYYKPLSADDTNILRVQMLSYELIYQVDFWFETHTQATGFQALFDWYLKDTRYIETDYTTIEEDDQRLFEKITSDIFIDDFENNSSLEEEEDEQGQMARLTYTIRLSPVWLFNTPKTVGLIKKVIIEFFNKYDIDKYDEDIIIE